MVDVPDDVSELDGDELMDAIKCGDTVRFLTYLAELLGDDDGS